MKKTLIGLAGLAALTALAVIVYPYWVPAPSPSSSLPTAERASLPAPDFGFALLEEPRHLPDLRFMNGEGHTINLADFRGKAVLLNIWATWCAPCRQEMPSLDRLQALLGGTDFEVVALSVDQGGIPVVKEFYQEYGIEVLPVYIDESGEVLLVLNLVGIPSTLLVDQEGREVSRKLGIAEWNSEEMVALIRQHLHLPPAEMNQEVFEP